MIKPLLLLEMDMMTQVQIQGGAVHISRSANIIKKGSSSSYGQLVAGTWLFNHGMASVHGKENLWVQTC